MEWLRSWGGIDANVEGATGQVVENWCDNVGASSPIRYSSGTECHDAYHI